MSEMTIFDYFDYREYIEARLRTKEFGRGGKAKLAEHLVCQPSFVSQVLKGKCSFSLEQGFKVNAFFKHNKLEKEYLIVLVEYDRAGTYELKQYLEGKLRELVKQSTLIENQMSYDQLSDEEVIEYYNNWNHVLIRNLIDIPKYKDEQELKNKLDVDEVEFNKALKFLVEKGLVQKTEEGLLEQGHMRLHVKKESPLAKYANITGRLQMIKNYEKGSYNTLNYGCNMTLPKKSFEEFKEKLKALIVDLNARLEDDQEAEMMAVLMVDLMEI